MREKSHLRWHFGNEASLSDPQNAIRHPHTHSELCARPYLILATDWELSRDMIKDSFSHSARSILRVRQTRF